MTICKFSGRTVLTFALAAALLAASVALKRADTKAARLVDDSHLPMHQEDQ